MFCPKCGTEDINGATFCGACGYKLQDNSQVQPVLSQQTPPIQPPIMEQSIQQPKFQLQQPTKAQSVEQFRQPTQAQSVEQFRQPTQAQPARVQPMEQPYLQAVSQQTIQLQQMSVIQPMQQALQASIDQYRQPGNDLIHHKNKAKRNIIIASSLVVVVVATIVVVLFILLGGKKSFAGNWKFEGFVAEGGETLYINDLQNIEDQTKFEFLKDRFLESELTLNEDGAAEFRSATENDTGSWNNIEEDNISIILFNEECKATIEDKKLLIIAKKSLYLSEFQIIGVSFNKKEDM